MTECVFFTVLTVGTLWTIYGTAHHWMSKAADLLYPMNPVTTTKCNAAIDWSHTTVFHAPRLSAQMSLWWFSLDKSTMTVAVKWHPIACSVHTSLLLSPKKCNGIFCWVDDSIVGVHWNCLFILIVPVMQFTYHTQSRFHSNCHIFPTDLLGCMKGTTIQQLFRNRCSIQWSNSCVTRSVW